jgi:hypothetical protein
MKGMLLLYQDQVVFDDVYIGVALTKPRKWANSVIDGQDNNFTKPLYNFFFCVFTLQAFSMGFYQRLFTFLSRSKSHKHASWSLSLENHKNL